MRYDVSGISQPNEAVLTSVGLVQALTNQSGFTNDCNTPGQLQKFAKLAGEL
jgi:hypothetical protein